MAVLRPESTGGKFSPQAVPIAPCQLRSQKCRGARPETRLYRTAVAYLRSQYQPVKENLSVRSHGCSKNPARSFLSILPGSDHMPGALWSSLTFQVSAMTVDPAGKVGVTGLLGNLVPQKDPRLR